MSRGEKGVGSRILITSQLSSEAGGAYKVSYLYVNENGAKISVSENRIVITEKDGMKRLIPIETLDGISVLGRSEMTTACIEQCLLRGIPVGFYSKSGKYFGRLHSTVHVNAPLQRRQAALYDTPFAMELSRRIIRAKISNQITVLRRYARTSHKDVSPEERAMQVCLNKMDQVGDQNQLIGYEGTAARAYFLGLSKCIHPEFAFRGRNRRPPKDPFNSMISLGYSILMNEIYGDLESRGLNPYFGFLHRDTEKHPTLCSDLMEEWRAILVDATAMSLINGNEISRDQFETDEESDGCYLKHEALQIFLTKLEQKMETSNRYLSYLDYPVSYRRAIMEQIRCLQQAVEEDNAGLYTPMKVR